MLVSEENLCLVADTHKDIDKVQAIKDFVHSVMEKLDGWRDEHKEEVEFLPLTLGMTNQLFAIKTTQEDCTHKSVVVRIYGEGTGDLIDRDNELWVQTEIGNLGLSAKVLARFNNGFILQHLPGCSLDPFVVRDPETSKGIARALAKLHRNLEAKGDEEQARRSQFWDTVDRWIAKIEKTNPNMVHEITVQHGDDEESQESVVVTAEALRSYAEEIQRFVESQDLPVVFCHNDLNSENIIRHEDTIYVIDFEYAGFNYRAFDLGNHFCEWAGVATKSDFAKYYPKEDEQLRFLQSYLLESQDEKYTQEDLEKLLRESQIGTLLSHFMWAIWGFTQDSISTLSYDYVEYATIRMQNFVKLWPSFVSSSSSSSSSL